MKPKLRLAVSVGAAHVIGSMIIKIQAHVSISDIRRKMVALRVPLYNVIGCAVGYYHLPSAAHQAFGRQLERL